MIVEEMTLRHWRRFREPRTFTFDERMTLIAGPNESGKTTLLEALTRAFFDRHNSKARELAAMQPLGGSLAPEVEVVFRAGARRYRVHKRFLRQPLAELFVAEDGAWRRAHEGDQADAAVFALAGAEPAGGGASRAEHRGIAQGLWYLQRDEPFPREAWADGLERGLGVLAARALASPARERVLAALNQAYAEHFSPKRGELRRGSELQRLEAEDLPAARARLAQLQQRHQEVQAARDALQPLVEQEQASLAAFEAAAAEQQRTHMAFEQLLPEEARRHELEHAAREAQRDWQRLSAVEAAIRARGVELERCEAEERAALQARVEQQARAGFERLRAAQVRNEWHAAEGELSAIEAHLARQSAVRRVGELEDERRRIETELERLEQLRGQRAAAEAELAALAAPSEAQWSELQALDERLRVLRARREAGAIRVRFELKDAAEIRSTPPAEYSADTGEHLVLRPTRFSLGELGEIAVRGGGEPLTELGERLAEAERASAALLKSLGNAPLGDLLSRVARRREIEQGLGASARELAALSDRADMLSRRRALLADELRQIRTDNGGLDADGECALANTRAEGSTVATSVGGVLAPDARSLAPDARSPRASPASVSKEGQVDVAPRAELEKRRAELMAAIQAGRQREDLAQAEYDRAQGAAHEANVRVVKLQERIEALSRQNAEALRDYGTLPQLRRHLEAAGMRSAAEQAALDAFMEGYAERVERPKREHLEAQRRTQALQAELARLREQAAGLRAQIDAAVAGNLATHLAEAEESLRGLEQRQGALRRRLEGLRLLWRVMSLFQERQASALGDAVRGVLNEWLADLTEQRWSAMELDARLLPAGLLGRDGRLPLESASFGTMEQAVLLLRLAMGWRLGESERQVVVLDDRFVNSDSQRAGRMCRIIERVAEQRCQVLLTTCDAGRYAGLAARVIDLGERPARKALQRGLF